MTIQYASSAVIRKDVSALLKAPRRMPVAEAVKKYMRVPMGGGSSIPWDDSLTPYIIEPMNCLTSRHYDAVIFVGPARTGKSLALIDGWVVYTIVCDPADFLLIQMTEEKAREHSKKRLDRTFRVSREVAKRLSPRTNDNNVHDKTFKAGNYLKIGWPSINIMSSSDYRFVALTDYDRFPEDVILLGYEKINWEKPPKWAQLPDTDHRPALRSSVSIKSTQQTPTKQTEASREIPSGASAWAPVSKSSGGWV